MSTHNEMDDEEDFGGAQEEATRQQEENVGTNGDYVTKGEHQKFVEQHNELAKQFGHILGKLDAISSETAKLSGDTKMTSEDLLKFAGAASHWMFCSDNPTDPSCE